MSKLLCNFVAVLRGSGQRWSHPGACPHCSNWSPSVHGNCSRWCHRGDRAVSFV